MTAEITTALVGLGVAALVAMASVVAVLGRRVAGYVDKLFDQKERELLRSAGEQGALIAEEESRISGIKGEQKLAIARQVVRSIMPNATYEQTDQAVVAGVAKLRASVPNLEALASPIPVTVVSSAPPGSMPLPAPAAVPK